MIFVRDKLLLGMALLRVFSGLVEFGAAILMIKFNSVEKALKLNSVLALIGPIILVLVSTLGLVDIADKVSLVNIVIIGMGVGLILVGIRL
ncbi:MAG: YqhV family protein [Bacillota bacterium]